MTSSAVEIANLFYRYVAAVDNADALGAAAFFKTAKAKFSGDADFRDEDGARTMFRGIFAKSYPFGPPLAKHIVTNPIVEIDEAANTGAVRAYYTHVKEIVPQKGDFPMQTCGAGRYYMNFERVGGAWRFASRADIFEMKGKYADIPDDPAGDAYRGGIKTQIRENPTRAEQSSAIAIANLLSRYAELVDNGDLPGAAALFKHAKTQHIGSDELLDEAATLALLQSAVTLYPCGTPRTKHLVTNPIIEVDEGGNTATCRSDYTIVTWADGRPMQVASTGRCYDRFVRIDGTWRFAYRSFVSDMSKDSRRITMKSEQAQRATLMEKFSTTRAAEQPSAVQISNLYYHYAELVDNGDLAAAAGLFENARARLPGSHRPQGSAAILAMLQKSFAPYSCGTPRTKHLITQPTLEIDEVANRAICHSIYTLLKATDDVPLQVIAIGRYQDRFQRVDGSWRFAYRDFTLLDAAGDVMAT